jgi:hypothetical protein
METPFQSAQRLLRQLDRLPLIAAYHLPPFRRSHPAAARGDADIPVLQRRRPLVTKSDRLSRASGLKWV